jgi:hypothetical protein
MRRVLWAVAVAAAMTLPPVAGAAGQSVVGAEQVRLMATAVELGGHDCEGMAGVFLGQSRGDRIYIVECRGGDRFVYIDRADGKVSVTSCAAMRLRGYAC